MAVIVLKMFLFMFDLSLILDTKRSVCFMAKKF